MQHFVTPGKKIGFSQKLIKGSLERILLVKFGRIMTAKNYNHTDHMISCLNQYPFESEMRLY